MWLDLYTRQLVGWCVAAQMSADLIIRAQRQALTRAKSPRGWSRIAAAGSTSRYKAELLEGGAFRDLQEAQLETFAYIEGYYNLIRRYSALGYLSLG